MLQLATDADRGAIDAIALQLHAQYVSWRPDLYEMPETLYPQERFSREVKGRSLYCAKFNGTVVGYTLLKMQRPAQPGMKARKVMRIEEFAVEQTCRNEGIGRDMMADVRALASAFGCTDLELGVYPQNDEAVGFWQKCGFTIRTIEMQQTV